MLHKSFKLTKCKTSLKLAISRIKLMKNKKGVQINQMKRDLSQLLDTAQDRTARIRVEHVIREEKMVAAYDLIEIYCELIVARLSIIESQKICPIDLKEAVTSVIFAAPRCSDISELSDIRKHFTRKYGKEFVSAATELRPDCGVSRLLVEKLSAIAPDTQTKIKVLSDVAKEHNIKWDPTSFEEKESKPPDDLLNGPSNFEKTSMTTADPPMNQASNIDVVHIHKEKQDAPFDFSRENRKYTLGTHNTTSTDTVGVETPSTATHVDMKSTGEAFERMEMRQPVSRGNDDFSSGRQNWNMEFKDATSAAQAAAESAERAAMAARAAAQFSRHEKIAKQHPTVSHDIRDEEPSRVSAPFRYSNESFYDDRTPKTLNQQTDQSEHDTSPKTTERFGTTSHDGDTLSSIPTSFRSHNDSIDGEKLVNNFHMADGYFGEYLNQDKDLSSPKMTTTLEGFEESKAELGSFESEDINCFAEEATKKQPSDELDGPDHQKSTKRSSVGNPFAVVDQRNLFRDASNTSSNLDSQRDDEAISDDDGGPRFDTGFQYDEVDAVEQASSQSHLFSGSISFPDHSVKYVEPSETDDHIIASFDHSDDPDSESETDLFSTNPEPLSVEPTQDFNSRKTQIELNDLVEKESSFYNSDDEEKRPESQQSSSFVLGGHKLKNNNRDQESVDTLEGGNNDSLTRSNDLDARRELSFGTLTGGLRNKGGLRYPPYTQTPAIDFSKKSVEESSRTGGETSLQSCLDSGVSRMEDKRPNVSISMSSSDSDSDDSKYPVKFSEKTSKQTNTRSRYSSSAVAFFDDDDDDGTDSEEVSKQASSRVHLGSGLSRRTRGPPFSNSKSHEVEPKTVISSSSEYGKPSEDEIPDEPYSYAGRLKEVAKQIPEPQQTLRKTTEIGSSKQSVNFKQEVVEEPKIPKRESTPPISAVERKRTNIVKKAGSHVHPNLPDYDSIAARLESLQANRQ